MAKLIKAGDFASAGEERAAEALKTLPASWIVICNKVLPQSSGYTSYEMDFVIIADHWIFLLDEKSWRGEITGNDQYWYRNSSGAERSPLDKVDYVAKILAGHLRSRVPSLADDRFVRGGVLLSSTDHLPLLKGEPRAKAGIFLLADVCKRLVKLDGDGGTLLVMDHRNQLADALTGLSAIPIAPKSISNYTIHETLFTRLGVRAFSATLSLGSSSEARILMVYDLGAQAGDRDAAERFYQREFQALKQLATTGVAPRVQDPFLWSDSFLVLPIEPAGGVSLAVLPRPEAQADLAGELKVAAAAFSALETIHKADVLHRALGPDVVFVQEPTEKPKVSFNNFYAARAGDQSISVALNELAIEDPYAAPELAMGYGNATPESDTFSLALIFLERLSGVRVSDLRAPNATSVNVPAFADRWTALPEAEASELTTLFTDILAQPDPHQRWSAGDIAKELSRISRALLIEQPTAEPVILDNRYEIVRTLGRGASATTYLAKDRDVDDLVAIKQFRDPQSAIAQIKAEWDTLSRINSERFSRIYDVFRPEHEAHVKLQYIPGPTLQEIENTLPWDLERWRAFAFDLLDALKRLEAINLLHRDIKPANIILSEDDGRPVLIDCGFALVTSAKGRPAGTPRFMPPESVTADKPPNSSDRYALALVLYRALTGAYPDASTDMDALSSLQSMGRASEELVIIQRLMGVLRNAASAEPSERPVSAQAFYDALIHALQSVTPAPRADDAPDLAAKVNPWVDEVRGLYRNSTAGNANNRGLDTAFVHETYIPTALDERLLPAIFERRPKAVFLSGNPGDGKTAFLGRVRERLERDSAQVTRDDASGWELTLDGHTYRSCYDASEAHGDASADVQLRLKLAGLEGGAAPEAALTVLVAINDGRLADFFERERENFAWLTGGIRRAQRANGSAEPAVWLVDLKRRAFVSEGRDGKPSVALRVLGSLTQPDKWAICEQCGARNMCPITANAAALRRPEIAQRLEHLLLLTHLRRQRHITMRDLRSTFAYLLSGDTSCADVHAMREERTTDHSPLALVYWRSIFTAPAGLDDLSGDLAQLDPAREPQPNLDRFLYFHRQPVDADQRRGLFADNADLAPQMYPSERAWIADVKRRLYFEGADETLAPLGAPSAARLLAYRYADEFLAAVRGEVSLWKLRDRIARGVLRSDGINVEPGEGKMGLKVSASDAEDIIILKEFSLTDFALEIVKNGEQAMVEMIPETLRFKRRSGAPSITLTLDHFELLMRLADGLQPDAPEFRPLLEDLVPFKNTLLLEETNDLTVIEGQGRVHHITQHDGKIVLSSTKG